QACSPEPWPAWRAAPAPASSPACRGRPTPSGWRWSGSSCLRSVTSSMNCAEEDEIMGEFRVEKDFMGEVRVPADAYFGAQTQRARENFPTSGIGFSRPFIRALGLIKKAAAETNVELGLLDARLGEAVAAAAQEVAEGRHDGQFVLD